MYDGGIFLKSQRKRPYFCFGSQVVAIVVSVGGCFPDMSFNKFHSVFCTVRNYDHLYHMTDRVSGESNDAYNGKLDDTKRTLQCMPLHTKRINKVAEMPNGTQEGKPWRAER